MYGWFFHYLVFLYYFHHQNEKGFDKFISRTMFGIVFVLWLGKIWGKTPGHCPQIYFSVCGIKISKILTKKENENWILSENIFLIFFSCVWLESKKNEEGNWKKLQRKNSIFKMGWKKGFQYYDKKEVISLTEDSLAIFQVMAKMRENERKENSMRK